MTALPVEPGSMLSGLHVFSAPTSGESVEPSANWRENSLSSHSCGSLPLFFTSKPRRNTGAPLVVTAISVNWKVTKLAGAFADGAVKLVVALPAAEAGLALD